MDIEGIFSRLRRSVLPAVQTQLAAATLVVCAASTLPACSRGDAAVQAVSAEPPPPTPTVEATVERTVYKVGEVTSPAWTVKATVMNPSPVPWQLGEELFIIEIAAPSAVNSDSLFEDAAFHVIRPRVADRPGMRVTDRFDTLFGYTVEPDGTAIIPFTALLSLAGKSGGLGLFLATMASPKRPLYPGGGYGQLAPGGETKFEAEVIVPFGQKTREEIVLVLPSFTPGAGADRQARHVWFEFPATDPKTGDRLTSGRVVENSSKRSLLRDAKDAALPSWRRRFALSWLADEAPAEAEAPLLSVLNGSGGKSLARAAIANAGTTKSTNALPHLQQLLADGQGQGNAQLIVRALGAIGDRSVAAPVRSMLDSKDEDLVREAATALGAMRDPESIPRLRELFTSAKELSLATSAAKALIAIGDEAAINAVVTSLSDPRVPATRRQASAMALDVGAARAQVTVLAKVLQEPRLNYGVASAVAEALGSVGDATALDALVAAASLGVKGDAADLAMRALVRQDTPEWRETAMRLASVAGSPAREKAIYYLGVFDVKAAAPMLRDVAAAHDTGAAVTKAACNALDSMKEGKPLVCRAR